ncbi:hypothetical protein VNI00_013925 [Paramarasmius palmivorus]|uniref:Uncharacterized protein n=1 Tax=Paramarasmius palmivorus TaxID=297713 RepID=A0AAW0BXT8_9AGAR
MLLLYALARPIASSLAAASSNTSTPFDPITGECIDINGCRTTLGILWSCLSVIFICTWVGIHPNIPIVDTHWAAVLYQNVEMMIIALLVPEFMILWAMRQRASARAIGNRFKKYGWGVTHGFFVLMGGFALYDGDKFCGYLWDRDRSSDRSEANVSTPYDGQAERCFEAIKNYHEKHQTHCLSDTDKTSDPYTPSENHPNPFSETELLSTSAESQSLLEYLLSKGYITLTEEEIKDRGHADFIAKSLAVTQTTWFTLQVVARAIKGLAITELEIVTVGFAILNFGTYFLWWNKPLRVKYPVRVLWRQKQLSSVKNTSDTKSLTQALRDTCRVVINYIYTPKIFDIYRIPHRTFLRIILLPFWIPWRICVICERILFDDDTNTAFAVPLSSRLLHTPRGLYIAVYGIGALFGGVHCIPWNFYFLSSTERLLWRISAVGISVAPVIMGVLHVYAKLDRAPSRWVGIPILLVFAAAYGVFRMMLIVIALNGLRDLPQRLGHVPVDGGGGGAGAGGGAGGGGGEGERHQVPLQNGILPFGALRPAASFTIDPETPYSSSSAL